MTKIDRRSVLRGGALVAATGPALLRASVARAQGAAGQPMPEVKALVFDTFGTVVDWRNGVAREAERLLKPMGYDVDWLAFAEAWRKEYGPGMEEVRSGRRPFAKLDILHRENLDRLLPRFKLDKIDEPTRAELNLAWHKLDAWPDVGPAFARLHKRFLMAPQQPPLGRDPRFRDRPRLQAAAEGLSGDLRSIQPQACTGDDVCRTQRRPRGRPRAWSKDRPYRPPGRRWPGDRRIRAEGQLRCRRKELRGLRRQDGGVTFRIPAGQATRGPAALISRTRR
jgi:hypothetical protein